MNPRGLINPVQSVIKQLYIQDNDLITRNLCERCLVHRLGFYLQLVFPEYFVDCEFNNAFIGKWTDRKRLSNSKNGNYVDILVHKRSNRFGENLLCFEVKKSKNYKDRDKDRKNLEILTSRNRFAYILGFYLILGKTYEETRLELYSDGSFVREILLT